MILFHSCIFLCLFVCYVKRGRFFCVRGSNVRVSHDGIGWECHVTRGETGREADKVE